MLTSHSMYHSEILDTIHTFADGIHILGGIVKSLNEVSSLNARTYIEVGAPTLALPPRWVCVRVCIYIYVCVCVYVCIYIYTYVHTCVCMYVCMYVYVCVCMCFHEYVCRVRYVSVFFGAC
jgi:hypothetical protein